MASWSLPAVIQLGLTTWEINLGFGRTIDKRALIILFSSRLNNFIFNWYICCLNQFKLDITEREELLDLHFQC